MSRALRSPDASYDMGVGYRGLFVVTSLAAILATTSPPPASGADTVTFDLAADGVSVVEHEAHLLFNLNTDNITNDSVIAGWNSMYLTDPGELSGRIVLDFESGALSGTVSERWVCDGDCTTSDGTPSYAATMDTGWTADMGGVVASADGDGWRLSGSILLTYQTDLTRHETPSMCGDQECYICADRLCVISETMTASADLEGWIQGSTIALSFMDRLEPDAHEMDLTDMRRTQFTMSRFAAVVENAVVAEPEPPPEEAEVPPPAEETPGDTSDEPTEQPQDDPTGTTDTTKATADDATTPAVDPDPDETDKPEGEAAGADTEAAAEDDDGLAFDAIAILILIALGAIGFVALIKPGWVRKPPRPDPRIPKPGPPIEPADTSVKTYSTSDTAITYQTTVEPVPPPPTYLLVNPADPSGSVSGSDKLGQVHTVESGREIEVLKRAGDLVQVRVPDTSPFWVSKQHVQVKPQRRT